MRSLTDEPHAASIALLLHDFSGGGSERIAIRLANRWAAAGRRVTIVAGSEAGPARSLVGNEVEVRAVADRLARSIPARLRFGRAAAGLLGDGPDRADIVVGPGNWHVPALAALRLTGVVPPLVCKISNPVTTSDRGPPGQVVFNRAFALATRGIGLVAMSPALAQVAEAALGRAVATIDEPNLPDDWTPPPPRTPGRTVVAVGRLSAQKDFALALKAFADLGAGWRLDLLGDGPQRAQLERIAARRGIGARVALHGHVADIAPFLGRASVLLSSSRYEGYPAVLVEALAAGVPVVTTPSSPAVGEILSHPSFGRVAAADAVALAGAVRRVAAGPRPDPAALAAMLDKHRIGRSAAAWLALLDDIVATRRARGAA